jgi:2-desacetyl-2-hydroxyethyl bacteriochlorophyllide A dehydrogenase
MEQIKQIVFTAVNKAEYLVKEDLNLDNLLPNQVVVKSAFTTVSAGTERANLIGDKNIAPNRSAGTSFPRVLGYNCAGTVVKVGDNVNSVKVGDRVVVYWSVHSNYNIVDASQVVKIEQDNVCLEDAAISFISSFPLAAIRKLNLEIGESLMVMGLGILGQIAVKLARVAGACPVIACDPVLERREQALKNGADYAFDPFDKDFVQKVKKVTDGGVKTAVEVTGVGAGLDETLDCMAKFGRVALLGCTRDSNFSIDYYRKVHGPGITLVGAHTSARASVESSHGNYTHIDDIKTVLKLCSLGRLTLKDLIKEVHKPCDCPSVYTRLAKDKTFPVGVQFDWREE